VGPRNHISDGSRSLHRNGQFWGLFGPWKSVGSLCCSKRDHSVLNNCTTMCPFVNHLFIIRSTPPGRPNKMGLKCPSVRSSTISFFAFNEIWYVGRGR